jgi:recombination protein RecR
MKELAQPIARLVEELKKLPGVGQKSAQRLAFHLLRQPEGAAEALAQAILEARRNIRTCSLCHNVTDHDPCAFCTSPTRDTKVVCVVETAQDIINVERTHQFRGLYHVLGGVIAPLDGVGPDQLNIKSLLSRLEKAGIEEVIVATNPTAEGEATALYLAKLLKPLGVRVTRPAMGIPMGGELEYTDSLTLQHALDGRREI